MIRYFIEECSAELSPEEVKTFKAGDSFFCDYGRGCIYNERIACFDTKEDALEALKSYRSHVWKSTYVVITFEVTEYGVSEVHFDDDGEEIDEGFGYWAFTPSPFTSED